MVSAHSFILQKKCSYAVFESVGYLGSSEIGLVSKLLLSLFKRVHHLLKENQPTFAY